MPSDDSQLDALEHSVDVAAVQNSLAHMSMPHAVVKNGRRPQANSPGLLLAPCWKLLPSDCIGAAAAMLW